MADFLRVRSVRTADGKASRLPRVDGPAAGLAAPGWTVYTVPGPALVALTRLAGWLARLAGRGLGRLVALDRSLGRCAGCGLWLRARLAGDLVDVRTGSESCPVTGVRHARWAVSGRG